MKAKWFIYMIECSDGRLYTGVTTDLERRFSQHQSKKGAKFFFSATPSKIVYQEKAKNRSLAQKREAQLKKLTRKEKLKLVAIGPVP